ncbi:MAG: flavodoxin-dependent (E)-4-hydroxy-3-methylbut-2-enyl-diphosphate synthase [Peptococcaceae bacterium]|nr:flavodoxin-dependent (E)-4-hydroxy-3-methylbut-2-enyl-diphosphate synthase [Peptococcaceae bacterium]
MKRNNTKTVMIGQVQVGGNAPIRVQSMTNTDTRDIKATLAQIAALAAQDCEIVRVAVQNKAAADALSLIIKECDVPLIADIHFDHRLALAAIAAGVDGLRINPGNIGGKTKVRELVAAAREREVPIRIGVNAGSLEKRFIERDGGVTAGAMVESALSHVRILEDLNYTNIKISIKASGLPIMLEAYRSISQMVDYPLHIGVTEAGTPGYGTIKSAIGIGILLEEGIGDTIRVSLAGDPVDEVKAAYDILKALGLRQKGVELIACPTCGRTQIDLIRIAKEVEEKLSNLNKPLTVAVMGCTVNGPGEAREADIGIAGGKGSGLIFRKGFIIRQVEEERLVEELLKEINEWQD